MKRLTNGFDVEIEVNEAYIAANKFAEKLLWDVGEIRDRIDELEKIMQDAECDNKDLLKHLYSMIEYMKRESHSLELSVDSFYMEMGA